MSMSDYLDINNEELLKDFFSEAGQQVENLESNILVIENDPSNREAIDEIFRAAHTLKGGSATVEMTELSGTECFLRRIKSVLLPAKKHTFREKAVKTGRMFPTMFTAALPVLSKAETFLLTQMTTLSPIPDKKQKSLSKY